jgi:hypothetical protein
LEFYKELTKATLPPREKLVAFAQTTYTLLDLMDALVTSADTLWVSWLKLEEVFGTGAFKGIFEAFQQALTFMTTLFEAKLPQTDRIVKFVDSLVFLADKLWDAATAMLRINTSWQILADALVMGGDLSQLFQGLTGAATFMDTLAKAQMPTPDKLMQFTGAVSGLGSINWGNLLAAPLSADAQGGTQLAIPDRLYSDLEYEVLVLADLVRALGGSTTVDSRLRATGYGL